MILKSLFKALKNTFKNISIKSLYYNSILYRKIAIFKEFSEISYNQLSNSQFINLEFAFLNNTKIKNVNKYISSTVIDNQIVFYEIIHSDEINNDDLNTIIKNVNLVELYIFRQDYKLAHDIIINNISKIQNYKEKAELDLKVELELLIIQLKISLCLCNFHCNFIPLYDIILNLKEIIILARKKKQIEIELKAILAYIVVYYFSSNNRQCLELCNIGLKKIKKIKNNNLKNFYKYKLVFYKLSTIYNYTTNKSFLIKFVYLRLYYKDLYRKIQKIRLSDFSHKLSFYELDILNVYIKCYNSTKDYSKNYLLTKFIENQIDNSLKSNLSYLNISLDENVFHNLNKHINIMKYDNLIAVINSYSHLGLLILINISNYSFLHSVDRILYKSYLNKRLKDYEKMLAQSNNIQYFISNNIKVSEYMKSNELQYAIDLNYTNSTYLTKNQSNLFLNNSGDLNYNMYKIITEYNNIIFKSKSVSEIMTVTNKFDKLLKSYFNYSDVTLSLSKYKLKTKKINEIEILLKEYFRYSNIKKDLDKHVDKKKFN